MWKYKFTVFTPTFNRAATLKRCYEHLLGQTFKDFEWLVVDDGSTDDTQSVVNGFILENKINIRYYRQHNFGKPTAINWGVSLAAGEFFVILDSDDALRHDYMEILLKEYDAIDAAKINKFAGVEGSTCSFGGKLIGTEFPVGYGCDFLDSDFMEIRLKHKVRGDKHGFIKTEIMKEYPMPIFPGEKYITEAVIWNRMAQKYCVRFINENIYLAEYRRDGLTKNWVRMRMNNPKGGMVYCREFLGFGVKIPISAILVKYNNLVRFSLHAGKLPDVISGIKGPRLLLAPVAIAVGILLYFKDILFVSWELKS